MITNLGGYQFREVSVPGYPNAAGTVSGSIVGGDATVIIEPIVELSGISDYGRLMNQFFYVLTALHETLHLARGQGVYSDRDLAAAAAQLGSQEDRDRFDALNQDRVGQMSRFYDSMLQKHCPRPQ
jgi:hypothetical protein